MHRVSSANNTPSTTTQAPNSMTAASTTHTAVLKMTTAAKMREWRTTKKVCFSLRSVHRLPISSSTHPLNPLTTTLSGGYHPVRIGEKFNNGKYIVQQKLGWGHFSTVWLVHDTTTGKQGALKVQKSASQYTEAAQDEILLLTQIRDNDPHGSSHCVQLLDSFAHVGPNGKHICMVFEVLGDNLLALIKHYNYRGIPIPFVRKLARQVLVGLDYLHAKCKIIHTGVYVWWCVCGGVCVVVLCFIVLYACSMCMYTLSCCQYIHTFLHNPPSYNPPPSSSQTSNLKTSCSPCPCTAPAHHPMLYLPPHHLLRPPPVRGLHRPLQVGS